MSVLHKLIRHRGLIDIIVIVIVITIVTTIIVYKHYVVTSCSDPKIPFLMDFEATPDLHGNMSNVDNVVRILYFIPRVTRDEDLRKLGVYL